MLSRKRRGRHPQSIVDRSVPARRYIHARDGRLIGWREGGSWHIVHADHLGSTRLVTTPTGAVGTRMGYSAFGETSTHSRPARRRRAKPGRKVCPRTRRHVHRDSHRPLSETTNKPPK
jgi:hypothetical protein